MFDKLFRSCTGETLEISQHEMNSNHESQGGCDAETTTTTVMLDSRSSSKAPITGTTCVANKRRSSRRKHYARTAAFIVMSSIYGQLLIVLCVAFFTVEIVAPIIPQYYFEAFYLYLYLVSLLFLLYVYIYLFNDLPKNHSDQNRIKTQNGSKKQAQLEFERSDARSGSHASIFLRIGGIVFGLGVMVYNGLEFGAYFEIPLNSPCYSVLLGVNPILQAAFTFAQMYFIFTYSKIMISRFKLIARLGLMHLVATNCCVWIRTLGMETLHELKVGTNLTFLHEIVLPLRNHNSKAYKLAMNANGADVYTINGTQNRSNPCLKEEIMGSILSDASPYLYPFIVEYSLIGAAFLYVMWTTIGHDKQQQRYTTGHDSASTPTSQLNTGLQIDSLSTCSSKTDCTDSTSPALYSCLGSSKGLFSGFLLMAVSVTSLIIFFVLVHHPSYNIMATLISDISHSTLLVLSSIAILLGFLKTRNFKFQSSTQESADGGGLRDLLQRISAFGLNTYSLFGVIAGSMHPNSIQHIFVMITSALTIIQVMLQSLFISDVVCRKRNSHKQPGRQLITFLLINNLTLWIIYTFEMQKVEASPVQLGVYGFTTWAIILRITLPLSIFYRFHSVITFAEVWKNSYKY